MEMNIVLVLTSAVLPRILYDKLQLEKNYYTSQRVSAAIPRRVWFSSILFATCVLHPLYRYISVFPTWYRNNFTLILLGNDNFTLPDVVTPIFFSIFY